MKFQSIDDFKGQSLEKKALGNFVGGYCCPTEGGGNAEAGITWSADTTYYNDQTGKFESSTKHQGANDKSTCDSNTGKELTPAGN